jgi:hypothetical protein
LLLAGDTDEPQEKLAVLEAKFSRHVLSKMLLEKKQASQLKNRKTGRKKKPQ